MTHDNVQHREMGAGLQQGSGSIRSVCWRHRLGENFSMEAVFSQAPPRVSEGVPEIRASRPRASARAHRS